MIFKTSKLTLIFMILFSALSAFATGVGDGTLPVIRSIDVEFIATDANITLPAKITLPVKKPLELNAEITSKFKIDALKLEQSIKVKNQDGKLKVTVESNDLTNNKKVTSKPKGIGQTEFVNELELSGSSFTQVIELK